jgi:hypothetical protein
MNNTVSILGVAIALTIAAGHASAEDKEPTAIIAIGAAGEWGLPGPTSFGPSVSVEFTAIKDSLEIEIGGASLFRRGIKEYEADLIFKKPFTLSNTVELMVGAGPSVSYTTAGEGAKWGATFALDFMFWPWPERKLGWFVEPTYTMSQGNEKSLAVSVGLLVPIP